MSKPSRKTYRLWKNVELQLEARAKEMNLTPAKALNVILAQALHVPESDTESDDEDDTPDTLPQIASHDAF